MRTTRITSLAVLAGALAGGLVLQAADDPAPPDSATEAVEAGIALPAARTEPTLTSTWYCAGGTASEDGSADHVVLIANPTDRARSATLTVLTGRVAPAPSVAETDTGEEEAETTTTTSTTTTTTVPEETTTTTEPPPPPEEVVEVPAQSRVEVRLGDIAESQLAGAVVEVEGGEVSVEHQISGPLGRATAPCASTASPTWTFPWGVTTRGDTELLVFMNPFPDDATVDISFATDEGPREAARFQGFVVPGRSVVGAFIHQDMRRAQVSAHVQVRGGRLVVDRIQMIQEGEDDAREGITLGLGVPQAAETWLYPMGETGDGLQESVVVYNPSDEVAEVEVEVLLDDPGELGPPEPFELTVPPNRYSQVDIHAEDRVPAGGHALIVRSLNGVPITAERVNSGVDPAPHTGITSVAGSPFGGRTWYFPGGGPTDERDQYLVLLNLDRENETTYSITGFRGGQTIAIQDQQNQTIPAGGRAVIRLGDHAEHENLPVVVTADGPIVAERGLYRIGGGGISQAMGIPLNEDLFVPDPLVGG